MAISAFLFSAMLEATSGNLRSLIAGDPSPVVEEGSEDPGDYDYSLGADADPYDYNYDENGSPYVTVGEECEYEVKWGNLVPVCRSGKVCEGDGSEGDGNRKTCQYPGDYDYSLGADDDQKSTDCLPGYMKEEGNTGEAKELNHMEPYTEVENCAKECSEKDECKSYMVYKSNTRTLCYLYRLSAPTDTNSHSGWTFCRKESTTTTTMTTTTIDFDDLCKKCTTFVRPVCVDGTSFDNICKAECQMRRKNPDYELGYCFDCNADRRMTEPEQAEMCNSKDTCLWKGGQCVPQQVIGPKNTNSCPSFGSMFIMEEDSCKKAAEALGYIWGGSQELDSMPTKCYVHNLGEGFKNVYFNNDSTNTPESQAQPLCTETDEGVRIEAPDPFTIDGENKDCEMSVQGEECECPYPVEEIPVHLDPAGIFVRPKRAVPKCPSHEYCDLLNGGCTPDCSKNISDWQCKCGTDSVTRSEVVCKSPKLCQKNPNRSDQGGDIVWCEDDTDGSSGLFVSR